MDQAARDRKTQSCAILRFTSRKAEEIVKHFQMKFGWNPRSRVGDADLHRVWMRDILPATLMPRGNRFGAALPHVRLGVEPDRSTLRREFECVLQQVRNNALELRRVEGKNRKLVVRQEIKRDAFFLKAIGPEPAHAREALVEIGDIELHVQTAGLERAVRQKILDELLQTLPAVAHVDQNFALTIVQGAQLLAAEKIDISVENRKRSFQIVRSRA